MCPNIHTQTQDLPSLAVPANAKMPKNSSCLSGGL